MMQVLGMLNSTMATAAISCVVCCLIVYSQGWHGKHTLDHDLSGVQKHHAVAVPRIGGVAVIFAIVLTDFLGMWLKPNLFALEYANSVRLLIVASLPAFFSGIIEDLTKRISVRIRLLATIASAVLASWLLGATVDSLDIWVVDQLLLFAPVAVLVTAFVVAGGANAINIIDGFNGLAASVVAIMLLGFGILAWRVGDELVLTLAVLGLGAALGFLVINFPSGRIFLGDGGAYFLGFWVSEIAVLLLIRNPGISAWQVFSICAYPVIEVLYSIYRRKIVGKTAPGAADDMHLHTLIYRYYTPRFVFKPTTSPWQRNALVTCLIVPVVGCMIWATLEFGNTIPGAMALVLLQFSAYLKAYKRFSSGYSRLESSKLDEENVNIAKKIRP